MQGVLKIPLANSSRTQPQSVGGGQLPYFLAGPENPLVEPAVRAVLEAQPANYFPLVFYGPSGTGKSHLAHGLAAAWKRIGHPGPVMLETGIDLGRQLADAVESQALPELVARHGRARLWILEDLETLAGKNFAQVQCSRLLDQFQRKGTPHVLTCRMLPGTVPGLDPRLQSRLMRGLIVNLALPSIQTRQSFLEELVRANHISCAPEAIALLAARVQGPLVHLRTTVLELAHRVAGRHGIHVQDVHAYWKQQQGEVTSTVRQIAALSAKYFSVPLRDLRGPSRKKQVIYARGVAVYLARQLLGLSFQHLGELFGNRDHSTILHSYRKVQELLTVDPALCQAVETLRERLPQRFPKGVCIPR